MVEFIDFLNKGCSILKTLISPNKKGDTSLPDIKPHEKLVALTSQS